MNRQTLIQLTAAVLLAGASLASQAAEPVGARIATGVGLWIAAQGNEALREIREELRENLQNTLGPLLPAAPQQTVAGTVSGDDAGLASAD